MINFEQSHRTLLAVQSSFYTSIEEAANNLDLSDKYLFTYQSHYAEPTVSAWVKGDDFTNSACFELKNEKWVVQKIGDFEANISEMLDILISAFGGVQS